MALTNSRMFNVSFKIYVGNLPWIVTDEMLRQLFEPYGTVHSAEVVTDRKNQRPRGFGFARMDSAEAGQKAIAALHGMHWHDRQIKIAIAKETTAENSPEAGN